MHESHIGDINTQYSEHLIYKAYIFLGVWLEKKWKPWSPIALVFLKQDKTNKTTWFNKTLGYLGA